MAKVISPTSGALFLGTLSTQSRSYLLRLFRSARAKDYSRFVEPACGAFAMSHLAIQAGFKPNQIEASDVSLFSAAMGYAITSQALDDLKVEVHGVDELADLDLTDPPTVLWIVSYLRLLNQSSNPVVDAARKESLHCRDEQIAQLAAQMERARGALGGMTFTAEDLQDHLDRVWDDPEAIVCVNPPTYTGGFEKYYDTGGRLTWNEPNYRVFDAETGLVELMANAMEAKALVICYQERKTGQAIGHPIYMEDGIRRARLDDQTHMYLCANRGAEALELAGGFGMKRRRFGAVEPGNFTILPTDFEPQEEARLETAKIPAPQALYYRAIWTHRFGLDAGGNLGHGTAIIVDGYLVGVFAYDQSFILGWKQGNVVGRLMIHYGMAVPNRSHRYNRLLTMVAMNHEVINASLDDYYATRVEMVATVQQTQYPESKEMRGLMKLTDRKTHPRYGYKLTYQGLVDYEPLDTVFGRWLKRERHWKKARAEAMARRKADNGKDS